MKRIDYFGNIGYGIDIVTNEPLKPVLNFTYDRKQLFQYNGDVLIPDQFIYDPSPLHEMTSSHYTGILSTAREWQQSLVVQVSGGRKAKGKEFSGEAEAANMRFSQTRRDTVKQYIEEYGYYTVLRVKRIQFEDALRKDVRQAAVACGDDEAAILRFFKNFGTHVLAQADIGGQMHLQTDLSITSITAKKIVDNKIDINAEAKAENGDYIKGKINFKDRRQEASNEYRSNSTSSVRLLGGNIFASGFDEWRTSLQSCLVPTQDMSNLEPIRLAGPSCVGHIEDTPHQKLALMNLKYTPIYEALNLDSHQTESFNRGLTTYLGGKNPFDDAPKRYDPDLPESRPLKKGQKTRFTMRGWMATYETWAGLKAKPGAYATVACKSDAEPGGWTEKTIYAGETISLRGKTPYLSKYMYVKFLDCKGDDDATVEARNKLVSW
jgi:hypothetical protein